MGNTFGNLFRLTSFGESHGPAMGGVIDGMPAGLAIDMEEVQRLVGERRPGRGAAASPRAEKDRVEVLSGLFEGKTLGTPIGFIVRNEDARSKDYDHLRHVFRPSHADYTYQAKYGLRDHRGGGRASARETVSRVVAGAFAMQALSHLGIGLRAAVWQVGAVRMPQLGDVDWDEAERNDMRCPDRALALEMARAARQARDAGDTLGGAVRCVISGVPAGLGEPVFDKLSAALAGAMLGIPSAKSFDMGAGRSLAERRGSQVLDTPGLADGKVVFDRNCSGGVLGGISTGSDIFFEVAFKPIASLMRDITTIDDRGRTVTVHPRGRHDVCAVPRAVPIVRAMAALVVLDHHLMHQARRL